MARDYEDFSNLDQLDDRELRDLVREHLAAHNGLDIDDIAVTRRGVARSPCRDAWARKASGASPSTS